MKHIHDNEFHNRWLRIFRFWKDNNLPFLEQGDRNFGLWYGVVCGWWDWVDIKRQQPIPFPFIIKMKDKPEGYSIAHALCEAGFFDSVSQARKAGWNKPATLGEHFFFKHTKRMLLIWDDEHIIPKIDEVW
jgi:hypothetical protein